MLEACSTSRRIKSSPSCFSEQEWGAEMVKERRRHLFRFAARNSATISVQVGRASDGHATVVVRVRGAEHPLDRFVYRI
jgi:hypothetical protein